MTVELIDNLNDFKALEPDWNRLLESSSHPNPFMTFEWLLSCLEVFGESKGLFVAVVRDGDMIKGVAPLMINDGRDLVFIGYPHNDYADFLIADNSPGVLERLWRTILENSDRFARIVLDQWQEEFSHWKESCSLLDKLGKPYRLLLSDSCPAMVLDDVEEARKKYYKRNITTYVNWYAKQGDFRFDTPEDRNLVMARLEDLFAQHIERRDQTPFPSQFNDDRIKEFYRRFVGRLFDRGWLRLSMLTLNDEFLALYLSLPYRNKLYLYTTSFNGKYSKRSPGQVILRFLFDHAVEKQYEWMDFARGDEGYKDRFANRFYQNRKIIVYSSSLSKKAADWLHAARYSKLADRLYRNKRVQTAKMTFLFFRRKEGLASGTTKALGVLFEGKGKKAGGGGKN